MGDGTVLAVLHLGAQYSGVATGSGPQASTLLPMPLGLDSMAAEHFKTTPPTPLALEHAIQLVEDAVMPLHRQLPQGAQLWSCDAAVRDIALLCGVPAQPAMVVSLDAIEHCFNRLARVVGGTPAKHEGLPDSKVIAMALVILRECMHHWQFAQITVLGRAFA